MTCPEIRKTVPTVFWDWNGTLLDDCEFGISVMNRLLKKRGLPLIESVEYYRSVFCFPVELYYRRLGLKQEDWEEDAHFWMDTYMAGEHTCPLRKGAEEAVRLLADAGCPQLILTASKTENMLSQLSRFPIAPVFQKVIGLDHIYATSKAENGIKYLRDSGTDPKHCFLIGDSQHDAETAFSMGITPVLISGGHQTEAQLLETGAHTESGPLEAARYILRAFSEPQ